MTHSQDKAVSEVLSFILIIAVIVAGIAIYLAVVSPEIEKAERIQHHTQTTQAVSDLKTGIDQLWIFDKPKTTSSILFPSTHTLTINTDAKLSFNHASGKETISLLTICVSPRFTYEGGALFSNQNIILPHSSGDRQAILITSTNTKQTVGSNNPILCTYIYNTKTTYTNVSNIQIAGSAHANYWSKHLANTKTITIVDYTIQAKVVV